MEMINFIELMIKFVKSSVVRFIFSFLLSSFKTILAKFGMLAYKTNRLARILEEFFRHSPKYLPHNEGCAKKNKQESRGINHFPPLHLCGFAA